MAANRRFRENLRASRKVFATNWGLFKASRVGVIGLGVMIAFVLMALLAPFMNLRDPIRWVAPSSDTLDTDPFWTEPGLIDTPNSFFGNLGRIETSPAFRVYPSADNANADRVYIASGTRLYAIRSWTPSSGWESSEGSSYINLTRWSPGVVSTNPVLVNYGDYSGSLRQGEEKYPEYILYVGMSDLVVVLGLVPEVVTAQDVADPDHQLGRSDPHGPCLSAHPKLTQLLAPRGYQVHRTGQTRVERPHDPH